MDWKKALQLTIALLITAGFLYYAFQGVSLTMLWESITKVNWLWAAVSLVVFMLSFYWRTFRWKVFLDPVEKLSPGVLWGPLMIGFAFNNILPFRAGEVLRPLALMKVSKVKFPAALSSIAVERIADIATLLALLIAMPFFMELDPNVSETIGGVTVTAEWLQERMPILSAAAAILMAGALSFLIPQCKNLYIRILHMLPLIPDKIKVALEGWIHDIEKGFACLRSPWAVFMTALHSVLIWLGVAFSYQVLSWGFPGIELTFAESLVYLVVICLVISIPSAPGFWGVFEAGGKLAIIMMGILPADMPREEAATLAFSFTLLAHFLQWLPITLVGLWEASRIHISPADAEEQSEENSSGESAGAAALLAKESK